MDARIEITAAMIKKARDYIPLAEKEAWVAENAPRCFDKLQITSDGEPVPPMYMVNTGLKSRYLMQALVTLYFDACQFESGSGKEWLMPEQEYDRWAGSHVLNQIERIKHEPEVRDKCFDLMFDYKDLEKRFSTQINGLLNVQNDSVIRQNDLTAANIKELPQILEQLKALQEGKKDGDTAQ